MENDLDRLKAQTLTRINVNFISSKHDVNHLKTLLYLEIKGMTHQI